MKTIRVSLFRPSLMPRILDIETACFPEEPYSEELFREYYAKCPELFLVGWQARRVAGYSITCVGASRAELISIAVAPEHRRTGIAQALLDRTVRALSTSGVGQFDLMVRATGEAAITFYRKNGFEKRRTIRNYYHDGAAGIRMSRSLRPH